MKRIDFEKLHRQRKPLVMPNVWDVKSAKVFEKLNFSALGTSSAAIADMLGYEDGERLTFSELEYIVSRITSNTTLPLSVDIESGYSRNISIILNNIKRLHDLHVVGINIEDSFVDSQRHLFSIDKFTSMIAVIQTYLKKNDINIFLNVRIDTFLLGVPNMLSETIKRVSIYEKAGADGVFVPCIENEADISKVVQATKLPLNVMCMPNLPDFEKLGKLGVKRISMGNFLHQSIYHQLEQTALNIIKQGSFKTIFKSHVDNQ